MPIELRLGTIEAGRVDADGATTLVGLTSEGDQLNLQMDFEALRALLGTVLSCIPELTLGALAFRAQQLSEEDFGLSFNLIGQSWLTVVMSAPEAKAAVEAVQAVLKSQPAPITPPVKGGPTFN